MPSALLPQVLRQSVPRKEDRKEVAIATPTLKINIRCGPTPVNLKHYNRDFLDPGIWSVFLARDPDTYAETFKPTSPKDRSLSMRISMFQQEDLFNELGAKWNSQNAATEESPTIPGFPLLSRLSDISSDAIYEPDEVVSLLEELLRAQQIVKKPRSIRALDNLIRIARWAQKLNVGIHFGGV